jgi:ankyrin repeat protein
MTALLLDHGDLVDINARNSAGATPLMRAIYMKRLAVVGLLLDKGARIDVVDKLGKTALHYAVINQQLDVIKQLLEGQGISIKADPNARDLSGETPLGEAMRLESSEMAIIKALLEAKADPSIGNETQFTPLHRAAETNHIAQLQLLVDYVQDTSKLNVETICDVTSGLYGHSALWGAVKNGHIDAVRLLLAAKANPSTACKHPHSPTPLWAAFANDNFEMAELLLHYDADPNQVNLKDQTILHLTRHRQYERWASLLISHGAHVSGIRDKSGREPVHLAASPGHPRSMQVLTVLVVEGRANLDAQDNMSKRTPLMCAAESGNARLTVQLIAWGARSDLADWVGRDAFYLACKAGDVESAGYLLAAGKGTQLNRVSAKGRTPLHIAAKYGRMNMVLWLLKYGADKKATLTEPFTGCQVIGTPADVAREQGHEDIAKCLDEFKSDGQSPVWVTTVLRGNSVVGSKAHEAYGLSRLSSAVS